MINAEFSYMPDNMAELTEERTALCFLDGYGYHQYAQICKLKLTGLPQNQKRLSECRTAFSVNHLHEQAEPKLYLPDFREYLIIV